jgi:hypothetical protein
MKPQRDIARTVPDPAKGYDQVIRLLGRCATRYGFSTGGTRELGWSAAVVIGHHALQGQPLLRIDARQP